MVSSLYCIWLIVPYKYVTGREPGKAAETVLEALSQETCYIFRGFEQLGEGVVCATQNSEKSCPQKSMADGFVWCTKKENPGSGFSFFIFP